MIEATSYFGLFAVSFLAATILPGSSELALAALLVAETGNPWILLAAASTGNVLGSLVNWILGRYLDHFRDHPWFPLSAKRLETAKSWFRSYGKWSLLLAWVPVIGDPLTIAAGALRLPLLPFLLLVATGKIARYVVVLAAVPECCL